MSSIFNRCNLKKDKIFIWLLFAIVSLLAGPNLGSAVTDDVLRIPTVEEQIKMCIGTPTEAICLAEIASLRGNPSPCRRAQDQAACQGFVAQALEANCTQIEEGELRSGCLITAAEISGDVSIIERHFPPGAGRSGALAIVAGSLGDLSLLESIDDNEQYDLARTYAIITMSKSRQRELSLTYCNNLRDNYQGEYPEDAQINWNVCRQTITSIQSLLQRLDGLESDEARDELLREMFDRVAQTQQVIEESLDIEPLPEDPFDISFVRAPTEVEINGPPSDLAVAWSGLPIFPLTVIYRPRDGICPNGLVCPTLTQTIAEDSSDPVIVSGVARCTESEAADVFFDYEVVLVDATGQETPPQAAGYTCMAGEEIPVTGPAWKFFKVVPDPNNGPLSDDTPRRSTACTPGETTLSIDHSRRSGATTTVDVTFAFSFEALPQIVGVGEVVEVPMTLTVAGDHISENVLGSVGFLGYSDTLRVAACSLTACSGSPDAIPLQLGISRILFPGIPSDPSLTFEVDAFLNDTSSVSSNCKTRYIYTFVPASE